MKFDEVKLNEIATNFQLFVLERLVGRKAKWVKAVSGLSDEQVVSSIKSLVKSSKSGGSIKVTVDGIAHAISEAQGPAMDNLGLTDWNLDDYWKAEGEIKDCGLSAKEEVEFRALIASEAIGPLYKLSRQFLELFVVFDHLHQEDFKYYENVGGKYAKRRVKQTSFSNKSVTPEAVTDPGSSVMALSSTPFDLLT